MNQITFTNQMTGEEYNHLRELAGFSLLSTGQTERGLEHTTFLVAARDGEQIVGMGRVLFDFGYTAYIGYVFVHPDYQRKGIGKRIVRNLMRQTLDAACEGDRIMFILGAAKGKEEFYEKLGFMKRPNEISGCGMSLSIVKTEEMTV